MRGYKKNEIVLNTIEDLKVWDEDRPRLLANNHIEISEDTFADRKLILCGAAARHLWQQGPDAWNRWVRENSNSSIDFSRQRFGFGSSGSALRTPIMFSDYRFPTGTVDFSNAEFGNGDVIFTRASFGGGLVDFSGAMFGTGKLVFQQTSFGLAQVRFVSASFEGSVIFNRADFGGFNIDFSLCNFLGLARFSDLIISERVRQFSFNGASFEKLFTFSAASPMPCPLDLRRTRISHNVVLNDLSCAFNEAWKSKFGPLVATDNGKKRGLLPLASFDREDSQKFRRLKEIASSNRNHRKALDFHVQEIRTRRSWETNKLQDLAQFFFWAFGDYGRSWLRPLGWIAVSCVAFAAWFWSIRTPINKFADKDLATNAESSRDFLTAITYSVSNMLSFIPTGRTAKQQGEELLFGGTVPDEILLLSGAQSILAVMLLFLLGLGLRNLFRV